MTDLLTLDLKEFAEQGASIQLEHPVTGKKLDSFIKIQGADSAEYKNAMLAIAKASALSDKKDGEEEAAKMLSLITLDWSGLKLGAETIEYSKEEAVKLYTRFGWISDQVFSAVNDRKLFLVNAKAV
tara:strand:+ start:1452 stop:1832 length:381 start_codon:yes stop_codon:yes gene_type:complete